MPDYNKGDFTQQGYGGYVSGGLHLNEKRCLTAKISTDEETAGLDSVEINIHDHLNDLDYTFSGENVIAGTSVIGQAPSGNIEITENTAEGEPLDVSQYATATVNVAGSGGDTLKKCTLTITNNDRDGYDLNMALGRNMGLWYINNGILTPMTVANGATVIEDICYDLTSSNEVVIANLGDYCNFTTSNLVNCVYDDQDTFALIPIDADLDSSATIIITELFK